MTISVRVSNFRHMPDHTGRIGVFDCVIADAVKLFGCTLRRRADGSVKVNAPRINRRVTRSLYDQRATIPGHELREEITRQAETASRVLPEAGRIRVVSAQSVSSAGARKGVRG